MASATIDPLSFSYQIFMMTSCQNFWNGNEFDLIYLDFEKAFYKVEHDIVFQEMNNIGIRGVVRGGGGGLGGINYDIKFYQHQFLYLIFNSNRKTH